LSRQAYWASFSLVQKNTLFAVLKKFFIYKKYDRYGFDFRAILPFPKAQHKEFVHLIFLRFCIRFLGPVLANFQPLWGHFGLGHSKKGTFYTAQKVAELNPQPSSWQTDALPLKHSR